METKPQPNRKLVRRRRVLLEERPAGSSRRFKPASTLVASAKLPDRRIRQLIRCYAEGMTPKEAIEACDISHVTVRRVYAQIRERLIDVGLYQAKIAPGAPDWWQEQERPLLVGLMRNVVRPHRGVRDEKIDPYFAEATYRRGNKIAPGQLYGLILKAIAELGPLNRKPRLVWATGHHTERFRLLTASMRSDLRGSDDKPEAKAVLHSLLDGFEQAQLAAAVKRRPLAKRAIKR